MMFERKRIHKLEDYFLELGHREEKGTYFYRINGYSEEIKGFIEKYYETAKRSGTVIEGKIPNPTEQNLTYYSEIMGMEFHLNMGFLLGSLKKWLPRMQEYQRTQVAGAIYDLLNQMHKDGKNENMLKNAYIKFMCWLYYKFEQVVSRLGNEQLPKILYEGDISHYELKLLVILSSAGCDVVLLQYHGDAGYLKTDPHSEYSTAYPMNGLSAFPETFSLKWLRQETERKLRLQQVCGPLPDLTNCTNAWMSGNCLEDLLKGVSQRGNDPKLFYNSLCRISGVEDKLTFQNQLYQFYLQLKNTKRNVVVVNQEIPKPTMEEIERIKRGSSSSFEQMAAQLSANIISTNGMELQRLMRKAFIDVLAKENERQDTKLNRLTNRAVYLLCWLLRYQALLFKNWKSSEIACFIYLGGCRDENESLFIKLLARLPVDVLLLVPNRNQQCVLTDPVLYEVTYQESMDLSKFPTDQSEISMETVAHQAEQELDTILYQDSGIYRNQQCTKATAVVLKTMYEEIQILWDQEMKYRPNFSVLDNLVTIPVLFAKVSGVKAGDVEGYWAEIGKLNIGDTFVNTKVPYCTAADRNPIRQYATQFLKNGKLLRSVVKKHSAYPYTVLREEIQDHILDKLQLLLDRKTIRGTYENGTEYTIIATVLNLNQEIVRLIQKFDFTRKNPKFIYINATEKMISLEDSIIAAFLSLAGFDVIFFIPTGYQTVENHFNVKMIEEHQIGEYLYDLQPPAPEKLTPDRRRSWREILFKRGT